MSDDFEALAREVFVEESTQMLRDFESSLLLLGQTAAGDPAWRDHAAAAFRAIHTIKGSAGIFGLDALVTVAHAAESVLDLLREERVALSEDLIALLLSAHDETAALCATTEPALGPGAQHLLSRLLACNDAAAAGPAEADDGKTAMRSAPAAAFTPARPLSHPVPHPVAQPMSQPQPTQHAAAPRRAVERAHDGPAVRVGAHRLDALIDRIAQVSSSVAVAHEAALRSESSSLSDATHSVHAVMQQVREEALALRMVPMTEVFARFPRLVREAARLVDKDIELFTADGDAEIDRALMEAVVDPLTHLVRNSVDHGIEPADERVRRGKPRKGHVLMSARCEAGHVVIEVRDDGRGLDRQRIRARAVERGLLAAQTQLDDRELLALICQPGFSTAAAVTELSGRGVGLDVVKRNVEALRGELTIESEPGLGTLFRIRVPMTLALLDAFHVRVGAVDYLVPMGSVETCLDLPRQVTRMEPGHESSAVGTLPLADGVLPFVDLRALFDPHSQDQAAQAGHRRARRSVVIARSGQTRIGLLVDRLLGEQPVVMKSLGPLLAGLPLFSGAAVLLDGRVACVLDVAVLLGWMRTQEIERSPA